VVSDVSDLISKPLEGVLAAYLPDERSNTNSGNKFLLNFVTK
jgi:hypothetical protein